MSKDNSADIIQLKKDIDAKEKELATATTAKDWQAVHLAAVALKEMNKQLAQLQRGDIFTLADFTAIAANKDAQLLAFVNKTIKVWINNQPKVYSNDKQGPWSVAKNSNPEAFVGTLISVEKIKDA